MSNGTKSWVLSMLAVGSCLTASACERRDASPYQSTQTQRIASSPTQVQATQAPTEVTPTAATPEAPERHIAFVYRPAAATPREYSMADPLDQHQILLTRGVRSGHAYPVVIALHGQPRRGQAPRDYRFPRVVAQVIETLVDHREVKPLILVTPVFRFEGRNWPAFELGDFLRALTPVLASAGVSPGSVYVFGHSGAAGCGGAGLNHVASIRPSGVGFFDTCIGEGFIRSVRELAEQRTRTLIIHSVETAGFIPRRAVEYDGSFDFGLVYAQVGLQPALCPTRLPEAPLRTQRYRCAGKADGSLALVIDTGRGEAAHEAVVPVATRYFMREYVR
ncbi:MAG TPA: hypothetical protein VIV60_05050 [Polyangiaceae bacterium]